MEAEQGPGSHEGGGFFSPSAELLSHGPQGTHCHHPHHLPLSVRTQTHQEAVYALGGCWVWFIPGFEPRCRSVLAV